MTQKILNILFIGDIIGTPGLELTEKLLKSYLQKYNVDCCIVNGENLVDGKGVDEKTSERVFNLGVHVITGGNHLWDNWHTRKLLTHSKNILRPLNYPQENPGNGFVVCDLGEKGKIGVLNLQGRVYMQPIDCPFKKADWAIEKIREQTKIIFIDFHAEATAEKIALGWYLDGRVTAIVGTHTHVQTSDARILPQGTAFISDVGMTGPYDSIIGLKKDIGLRRFISQTPFKYEIATNDVRMCGVYVKADAETGRALEIESFIFPKF